MKLERLDLYDFRNMERITLPLCAGVNLIHGENAQGKTNLIEAVWLFSGNRSFRGAKDSELLRFGRDACRLDIRFFGEGREQTAALLYGTKRAAFLNEIKLSSPGELCGVLPMVVFSPIHLSLIKDGPAERRHFLDSAIGQIFPTYQKTLQYYGKALLQRNCLLRDAHGHAQLLDTLEIWDQNLARAGAQLIRMRQRFVDRIAGHAAEVYAGISRQREALELAYHCSLEGYDPALEVGALRALFLRCLHEGRGEDLRQQTTCVGAHRDDLAITLDGKSARLFGSQGQQRSCVLALKLSECGIIEESTGKAPIILLDDVMSELDRGRRDYLLSRIGGNQVFITCCEEELFSSLRTGAALGDAPPADGLPELQSFYIEGGALSAPAPFAKGCDACICT